MKRCSMTVVIASILHSCIVARLWNFSSSGCRDHGREDYCYHIYLIEEEQLRYFRFGTWHHRNAMADAQAKSMPSPEIIHSDELSAAKVSISLSVDHLFVLVPLDVSSSGTAEAFCCNPPAAAKYVLVLLSLIVTSLLPPPPGASTLLLVSVS